MFSKYHQLTRLTNLNSSKNMIKIMRSVQNPNFETQIVTINHKKQGAVCSHSSGGGSSDSGKALVRQMESGKCRLAFIPEEFFLMFHKITGVSGPYILIILIWNYLFSKEIYVMDHEYYGALSLYVMYYYLYTQYGTDIGAILDKAVDDDNVAMENTRKRQKDALEAIIKEEKLAQWQANGQKLLIDAKKENIAMQLEADFRERQMLVYNTVKDRMEYHVKKDQSIGRIHQKFMIEWILNKVMESITPEFEQAALNQSISELSALSSKKS